MNKKKKAALLGALLVLAASAGMIFKGRSGLRVGILEVAETDFQDHYTEDGVIHRGQQYKILSRVSGTVLETAVEENTEVHAGDLIMKIDSRDLLYEQQLHQSALEGYEAQLSQSQISQLMSSTPTEYLSALEQELQSAAAALQLAQTKWEADSTLYGEGFLSKADMEQTEAAYEQAKADKEKAENRLSESRSRLSSLEKQGLTKADMDEQFYESTLDQLRALLQSEQTAVEQLADQIEDCVITADRDGIISSFAGRELSAVQAGQEVAVISGTSGLVEAEAQVLTTIEPYIKVGDQVTVTQKLRGQELSYDGKVTEVYDFANQTTSALGLKEYRVTVKAVLEAEGTEALKDGYGVDMSFMLYNGENCLVIPAGAVFHFQDQDYVYVVEDSRAVKRAVTLEYQSGTQAVVKSGIEKGTVLVENVDEKELYEGVRVRGK